MATPYLKMVQKTLDDIMKFDRPLNFDKLTDYVENWFKSKIDRGRFVTRASYNKILQRKINATIRAIKAIGTNVDILMETNLRAQIHNRIQAL